MLAISDTKMLCRDQLCVGTTGPCRPKALSFSCPPEAKLAMTTRVTGKEEEKEEEEEMVVVVMVKEEEDGDVSRRNRRWRRGREE
jgi:hypothetical protein